MKQDPKTINKHSVINLIEESYGCGAIESDQSIISAIKAFLKEAEVPVEPPNMGSRRALELWADGKAWQLRRFFSGGGSMANLSSKAVIGEVEAVFATSKKRAWSLIDGRCEGLERG